MKPVLAGALVCALLCAAPARAAELDLETLDGPTAVRLMDEGKLTSVELTRAYIARIAALNKRGPGLNAVTQLNPEALRDAARLDKERRQGRVRGPAHGLPVLLKDLIDVKGMYTSAGNYSLRNSFPAIDSGVAKHLRERGAVILGKVGLSEFANFFGNQPSGFANLTGQVLNAVDADQNPSGSSSGSGSAGAAAMSMLMVGTETSGSIISPSNANGLVGLRPTVGLVPGYGIAPISASQDTAGPMDRTVANAALTLQSIAGHDPHNEEYYRGIWGPGINDADIIPPVPPTVPNYLSALDPNFVRGKRIGYNGNSPQVLEAKAALEAAGAILIERPVITEPGIPGSVLSYEAHRDIDAYYRHLGPDAPIKSLAEEVADNQANAHEALKFGNNTHANALAIDISPDSAASVLYRSNLLLGKQLAQRGINRMMTNDTPDDPSDDFIAILGSVSQGARAGYPQLTIPMGYSETHRRTLNVSIHANAYKERDLLGVAYVIEQATKKRKPVSEINPSMYRCAKTVPAPPYASRGSCNPDYESVMKLVGAPVILPFSLELESAASLQERLTAGTLTSETLVKAYLTRIALTNAEGPALQAVRAINRNAIEEARALDRERATSGPRGPLHGLPVLIDDTIDVQGLPTTAGSIALQHSKPRGDAVLVAKLRAAGAIILGKTNVTELGGVFDTNLPEGYSSLGGQVLLPSDTDKTVAGSSAGAAASTAAGLAAFAVGLETAPEAAQLIAPAGVAGVVGFKPTVGAVDREGVLGIARSQDSPGPIARTVADAATAFEAMSGRSVGPLPTSLAGKRVAVIDSTAAPYPSAVAALQSIGAETVVKTVGTPSPNPPSIVLRSFERDLNAYLGGVSGGAGSLQGIVNYNEAHPVEGLKYQQRELLAALSPDLSQFEEDLATGKAANAAVIDALLADTDVIMVPSGHALVGIADRAGYPVLTVPAGYGTGNQGRNPIGVTFVAAAGDEAGLLAAGHAFERATNVRLAPSYTNPSMFRCVPGSDFFSPHHCHPGDLLGDVPAGPTEFPVEGDVGGTVPATLSLALGPGATFGAFTPGVTRTYTASMTATVTSTAGDGALTVTDPSSVATGRLVNGSFALEQPLQGLGVVETWSGPVANDMVTVEFAQTIGATESLRTGTYAKTLTFTLSTTAP